MGIFLARVACLFLDCKTNPETCFCGRCGRKKHLWVETPDAGSRDFEFCGMNSKGGTVYVEIVRSHYTCSRCGENRIKTTRKHVHY